MRFRDILAVIALIFVAIGGQVFRGGGEEVTPFAPAPDNPRRPAPHLYSDGPWDAETRAWMADGPTSSPFRGGLGGIPRQAVIDVPTRRGSGTGTAFAMAPGIWLTARHVVDGCDTLGVQIEDRRALRVDQVLNHPNADVALLRTSGAPDPFALGTGAGNGDLGYMIGFPKGQPGAVHGRKIGTTILRERGRFRTREIADVWSERSRIPDRFESLGGLSGGPVFTADGRIAGIVLAEERRRGRMFTAQPATVRTMLERGGVTPAGTGSVGGLTPGAYPTAARDLLTSLRIAKVLCRVR